jgi:hypothetical protein
MNCEKYLRVKGQRFQHLPWSVNKGKNFPLSQILSACWVIGKIRAGRGEAQSRERVKFIKNTLYVDVGQ